MATMLRPHSPGRALGCRHAVQRLRAPMITSHTWSACCHVSPTDSRSTMVPQQNRHKSSIVRPMTNLGAVVMQAFSVSTPRGPNVDSSTASSSASGEIDLLTVPVLESAMDDQLNGSSHGSTVEVDLAVVFLSARGISALVAASRSAAQKGVVFRVRACHPSVRRVIDVVGVAELLGLSPHGQVPGPRPWSDPLIGCAASSCGPCSPSLPLVWLSLLPDPGGALEDQRGHHNGSIGGPAVRIAAYQ